MQKAILVIREADRTLEDLNDHLANGWRVVSVTTQHVSVAVACSSYAKEEATGAFLVIVEKT